MLDHWTKTVAAHAEECEEAWRRERDGATPGGQRHAHLTAGLDRLAMAVSRLREAATLAMSLPEDAPTPLIVAAGAPDAYAEVAH